MSEEKKTVNPSGSRTAQHVHHDHHKDFIVYEKKDEEEQEEKKKSKSWFSKNFPDIELIRKSYSNPIGQPVFRRNLADQIKKRVLESGAVQQAINEFRQTNPTIPRSVVFENAREIVDRLSADYEEPIFRGMAYIVVKILQQLYNGIHVSEQQLERLKEVARKAEAEKIPLILLPTHKSHIDYLVVSFVFFMCNISVPFIAGGDNLMIPIVGELLRHSGAFFIRRKFDNDAFYKVIFKEYVQVILEQGFNLEFFIEGGRSRVGKLLRPKMGLLSIVSDAVLTGRIKDAYLVPISIGYDKVIETESYVKELLGGQKEKESLRQLIFNIRLLKLHFGRIDMRIARPFSLREYMQEEATRRKMNITLKDNFRELTQVLAFNVLHRINKASVIMPTSIVVSAILTHRGRGISKKNLEAKFIWLRDLILKRGGKVAQPDTDGETTSHLVDVSIEVLGNLIGKQKNVLEPIFTPNKRFELSYYRNQVIHLFINDGVTAVALYGNIRFREEPVNRDKLFEDVSFLSTLLKIEVIFQTERALNETLDSTLKQMQDDGVVAIEENSVRLLRGGFPEYDFLCAMFWPFIDSYWLLCASLYSLYPDQLAEEKAFLGMVQELGFTLYYQGELGYYESISKDMLNNALNLFTELKVAERRVADLKGLTVIKLHPSYAADESRLVSLISAIGKFRREPKYSFSFKEGFEFTPNMKAIIKRMRSRL